MFVKIKIIVGAKEESFKRISDDRFEVSVRELPERGFANNRLLELVREHFRVYNGSIRIVSGHHKSNKIISIKIKHDTKN